MRAFLCWQWMCFELSSLLSGSDGFSPQAALKVWYVGRARCSAHCIEVVCSVFMFFGSPLVFHPMFGWSPCMTHLFFPFLPLTLHHHHNRSSRWYLRLLMCMVDFQPLPLSMHFYAWMFLNAFCIFYIYIYIYVYAYIYVRIRVNARVRIRRGYISTLTRHMHYNKYEHRTII